MGQNATGGANCHGVQSIEKARRARDCSIGRALRTAPGVAPQLWQSATLGQNATRRSIRVSRRVDALGYQAAVDISGVIAYVNVFIASGLG